MASSKTISSPHHAGARLKPSAVKIPKPKDGEEEQKEEDVPLPQTLVRIPTKDAPRLQQATANGGVGGE